jgi:starvation-inducible DNA-binding protein
VELEQFYLALKTAFASEYAFLVKAQNFHWNVVGRLFAQDHGLFERIYTEVEEVIDDFAENLRKVGTFVPASLSQMGELSVIADAPEVVDAPPSADLMLAMLLEDSDKMVSLFRVLFELAEEYGYHGLSNFLADRQDAHSKHSWMLRSSLRV